MSNEHVAPTFSEIVDGFMGMRALKPAPAPDATEYHVPVDPAEIAQLLGSVYRDAHAAGYSEGWQAGLVQGTEDGERAAHAKHDDTIHDMVKSYAELWTQARRTISDMEFVIRQLAELDNGQIKATLQGSIWSLQAQLDKGDK